MFVSCNSIFSLLFFIIRKLKKVEGNKRFGAHDTQRIYNIRWEKGVLNKFMKRLPLFVFLKIKAIT